MLPLYHGGQFYLYMMLEYLVRTTDLLLTNVVTLSCIENTPP